MGFLHKWLDALYTIFTAFLESSVNFTDAVNKHNITKSEAEL